MEINPLVSILVPVYNVEKYLSHCLDSIISQTYSHLQIVLFDDGSKDISLAICKEYADKDKRIEVFHQENQGVTITRNHLLEKVKGEYVLFIDSDDWIENDMVEHLLSLGVETGADIVMCDRVINDTIPSQKELNIEELTQEQSIEAFLHHDYFVGSLWNKLFKSILLHNLTFPKDVSYGEDAFFCWHVLQTVKKVVVTNKQLYHYRITESNLSHSYNGHQFSAYKVWDYIVNDVEKKYPQFLPIAQAHFCLSMTIILYNAARHGSKPDENTKRTREIIKKHKMTMYRHTPKSLKKFLIATLLSWNYNIVCIFFRFQRAT